MREISENSNFINKLASKTEDTAVSKEKRSKELKDACAEFEGMFLSMMMKTMRQANATMESELIKKNKGEEIFTEMLDSEYVTMAAKSDNTGLGNTLYKHIINTTEEYKDLRTDNSGVAIESSISKLNRLKQDATIKKDIGLDLTY